MKGKDPWNLQRFVQMQDYDYEQALGEIRRGHKQSHWIWYIFPQIEGLGRSSIAQEYSISCLEEAKAYMEHPVLREHLLEISQALLELPSSDPFSVMGPIDDMKLKSSMTLFEAAAPEEPVFGRVLDKFYGGARDQRTLAILREKEKR